MNKKGISAIIATILLLMITIALAGTAYVYMSGMLTGRTSKIISLLDASCTNANITVVISNDGTADITLADDIKVFVDNIQDTAIEFSPSTTLPAHGSTTIIGIDQGVSSGNSYTVLVVSPSSVVRSTVFC